MRCAAHTNPFLNSLALAAKTVLIVYAHQSSASFNDAAKVAAEEVLAAKDYKVYVSDLYAMKFKATATAEDITGEGPTGSWLSF